MDIAGQILSILGMVCNIGSMQCKDIRKLYACQFVGATLFGISYLLLGSPAGAILNIFAIARGIVLLGGKRLHRTPILVGLMVLLVATSALSLYTDGWLGLLPVSAQLLGTLGMWTRNSAKLRVVQIFACSPMWLTYNSIVGSLGGILCEAFTILSVIVSFLRFGWKGLLADQNSTPDKEDPS